jgi:hypothetical protein
MAKQQKSQARIANLTHNNSYYDVKKTYKSHFKINFKVEAEENHLWRIIENSATQQFLGGTTCIGGGVHRYSKSISQSSNKILNGPSAQNH